MSELQARLNLVVDEASAGTITSRLGNDPSFENYPIAAFETDPVDRCWTVSIYVPVREAKALASAVSKLVGAMGHALDVEIEHLEDTDWVARSLEGLAPVSAGRFLIAGSHDAKRRRAHQRSIVIDAGQAFGTGHHGTTVACLEMLDICLRQRGYRNILDLGTGTGVLAIAAAKSVPARIFATDIDSQSALIAHQNARANEAHTRVRTLAAAGLAHRQFGEYGPFDLVIANILAGPLAHLARDMCRNLSSRATIILSGLLPHQKARVVAAYRKHGMILRHAHCRDGWLALVFDNYRYAPPLALGRG